ncbi:MAG: TolC family protein, partial [Thermoguttaceae bacterium]|nr:TolC family protein [Thermoguttaceae bacterium]
MTLAELEQTALLNNPTIQGYEQKINALNGYWVQAGLGPNPEIGYVGEEMSGANPGGRQGFELSQEFLGGNQLHHAQQVVCQQIATAQQELEIAKTRVLTDVRVAAYEYLAIQNKLFHLREILKNDQQMA